MRDFEAWNIINGRFDVLHSEMGWLLTINDRVVSHLFSNAGEALVWGIKFKHKLAKDFGFQNPYLNKVSN
jgi:hypothetical protein